jgi:hypothetical protein
LLTLKSSAIFFLSFISSFVSLTDWSASSAFFFSFSGSGFSDFCFFAPFGTASGKTDLPFSNSFSMFELKGEKLKDFLLS